MHIYSINLNFCIYLVFKVHVHFTPQTIIVTMFPMTVAKGCYKGMPCLKYGFFHFTSRHSDIKLSGYAELPATNYELKPL